MSLRITQDMDPERALWIDTGIPVRYRALRLNDTYSAEDDMPRYTCAAWLHRLPEQQRLDHLGIPAHPQSFGQGLLFVGPPGTGKTTLACATACEVRRTRRPVFFVRWPDYVDAARFMVGISRDSDEAQAYKATRIVERCTTAFLVVLDDVGHEHTTGTHYAEDRLEQLLRGRHAAGRPTAITSNLTASAWANRYSAALRSFMAEATIAVPMTGPDLRGAHA